MRFKTGLLRKINHRDHLLHARGGQTAPSTTHVISMHDDVAVGVQPAVYYAKFCCQLKDSNTKEQQKLCDPR